MLCVAFLRPVSLVVSVFEDVTWTHWNVFASKHDGERVRTGKRKLVNNNVWHSRSSGSGFVWLCAAQPDAKRCHKFLFTFPVSLMRFIYDRHKILPRYPGIIRPTQLNSSDFSNKKRGKNIWIVRLILDLCSECSFRTMFTRRNSCTSLIMEINQILTCFWRMNQVNGYGLQSGFDFSELQFAIWNFNELEKDTVHLH